MSKQERIDAVDALVSKIKEGDMIKLDEKGIATISDEHLHSLLPEGVTAEDVVKHDIIKADIAAATAVALGTSTKSFFDEKKDIDKVVLKYKLGRSDVAVLQSRSVQFNNGIPQEGKEVEKVTHEGYTTVRVNTKSSLTSDDINQRVKAAWGALSN